MTQTWHEHCAVCGKCFINGYTKNSHPCDKPIDPEVEEVMKMDLLDTAAKSRLRYRVDADTLRA